MIGPTTLLLGALAACRPPKDDTANTSETGDSPTETGDSTGDSAETRDTSETGDSAETGDTAVATLHGTSPDSPVPVPDFSATNRDGTSRGPADLMGHPTALWFYPAAFTGG